MKNGSSYFIRIYKTHLLCTNVTSKAHYDKTKYKLCTVIDQRRGKGLSNWSRRAPVFRVARKMTETAFSDTPTSRNWSRKSYSLEVGTTYNGRENCYRHFIFPDAYYTKYTKKIEMSNTLTMMRAIPFLSSYCSIGFDDLVQHADWLQETVHPINELD